MPVLDVLDPESQILHTVGRMDATDADLRALVGAETVWPRLIWLAQRDRAEHTLYHRLSQVEGLTLPDEADQLRTVTMVSDFRMAHLQSQLLKCVTLLREQGIEALPLKGGSLALTVYGSFAARPMIDIDVLVPAERAREAWTLLQDEGGWRLATVDENRDRFRETHHHHLAHLLEPSGTGAVLEVHTALFPPEAPFELRPADLWAETLTTTCDGVEVRVPSVRHQIVHLGIHFAWSHLMASAAWRTFRDLAHLMHHYDVDWDSVISEAKRVRATTSCYWTLRLARELQQVAVPDKVLRSLAPPLSAGALMRLTRAYAASLSPLNPKGCPSVQARRVLWKRGIQPKWSGHTGPAPWNISEEEAEVVGTGAGQRAPLLQHIKRLPAWLRFLGATMIGSR